MGKIIKNIVLILIGFLLISLVFAAFSQNTKVNTVAISQIGTDLSAGKIATLTVTDSTVTAQLKNSDTQEQAKITTGTDVVSFSKIPALTPVI